MFLKDLKLQRRGIGAAFGSCEFPSPAPGSPVHGLWGLLSETPLPTLLPATAPPAWFCFSQHETVNSSSPPSQTMGSVACLWKYKGKGKTCFLGGRVKSWEPSLIRQMYWGSERMGIICEGIDSPREAWGFWERWAHILGAQQPVPTSFISLWFLESKSFSLAIFPSFSKVVFVCVCVCVCVCMHACALLL